MPEATRVDAFVGRLEDRIAREVDGQDRVALAYSGGLSSMTFAMIARKRCNLECFVAGREGAPDVEAAKVAKTVFDLRVEHVLLDRAGTQAIRERLSHLRSRVSPRNLDSLIPLQAVLERTRGQPVLSGFGGSRTAAGIAGILRALKVRAPLVESAHGRALPRSLLREAAVSLGLPNDWARIPHRNPVAGAQLGELLVSASRRDRRDLRM